MILAPGTVLKLSKGHRRVTNHRENPTGSDILWTAAHHGLLRGRAGASASKQCE
jgi:hypothetical protein